MGYESYSLVLYLFQELCSKIPSGKYSELTWTVTNRKWVCMAWWELLYLVLELSLRGLCFVCRKKCSIFHAFPAISQDTEGTEQLLGDIPRKKGGPKQLFPCENWPSQLSRISQSGTGPNSDKYLLHLLVPFMFLAIWWNVWAEIKLWV